jgi:hypothetical protein
MNNAPVPPPAYHRAAATALHVDTLVTRMHLLEICRAAAQLASSSVYHRHTAGLCLLRRVCQLLEQRHPLFLQGARGLIVAQRLLHGLLQ